MNLYLVTGPRPVLDAAPGDTLEHPLTEQEERDHLAAGRLQIVPADYRVVGPRQVHGTPPGGTFTAALTLGEERTLVESGHVERVPDKPAAPAAGKTPRKKE